MLAHNDAADKDLPSISTIMLVIACRRELSQVIGASEREIDDAIV